MERWELEADLGSFTTTGEWVDNVTPEWAQKLAKETGRDPRDQRVIFAGYAMLVKMLHEELTRSDDRVEMGGDW